MLKGKALIRRIVLYMIISVAFVGWSELEVGYVFIFLGLGLVVSMIDASSSHSLFNNTIDKMKINLLSSLFNNIDLSTWISAVSTLISAIATVFYVLITNKTLKSIQTQSQLIQNQITENIRLTSLSIQPFLSVSDALIKFSPPSNISKIGAEWQEYMGIISMEFLLTNTGQAPAQNIHLGAFLLTNINRISDNPSSEKESTYTLGLFSKVISVLNTQKTKITCSSVEDNNLFPTYVSLIMKEDKEVISIKLAIFAAFQDICGQKHVQYFVVPIDTESLVKVMAKKNTGAKEVLDYIIKKADMNDVKSIVLNHGNHTFSAMSVDDINNIAEQCIEEIYHLPLFKEDNVEVELDNMYSKLISSGLPDPLANEKSFDSIKNQLYLSLTPSDNDVLANICNLFQGKDIEHKSENANHGPFSFFYSS